MNGKIKFFDSKKGFGFIVDDETNNEYFFHITSCLEQVDKDDIVNYEITNGKKGMCAIDVKILETKNIDNDY